MRISRRSALTGATAAMAAATIPAGAVLADGSAGDAELFAAIAHWRAERAAFQAENDRIEAIYERVAREFPDLRRLEARHSRLLDKAPPYIMRSEQQQARIDAADRACIARRQEMNRRLDEAGYQEDTAGDLSAISCAANRAAFAIPARTPAGLIAKLDMALTEFRDDMLGAEDYYEALRADVRRLAGEASS